MRVVHIVPALFGPGGIVGGAERYAFELARHMSASVPTTLVGFGDVAREEWHGALRVRTLPAWHVRGQRSNPFSLAILRELEQADVVHCHQQHVLVSSVTAAWCRLRGRRVFERLAGEEQEHLATLEARYAELVASRPGLEAEPTFLFFKGAANGLFAAGTQELRQGDGRAALQIGIRCERGSYKFFKRYGERFEESEGKRIFLEFASEERAHLELLRREYRALEARVGGRAAPGRRRASS